MFLTNSTNIGVQCTVFDDIRAAELRNLCRIILRNKNEGAARLNKLFDKEYKTSNFYKFSIIEFDTISIVISNYTVVRFK